MNNLISLFHQSDSNKLFDIAICKCKSIRSCECAENQKLTREQYLFLNDQRGSRQNVLDIQLIRSNLNQIKESTSSKSTEKRKNYTSKQKKILSLDENSNLILPSNQGMSLRSRFVDYTDEKANAKQYNTQKYPITALVADRIHVTNNQATQMINATLVDLGLLSNTNKSQAVGIKKIYDARKRERQARIDEISFDDIEAIFFDGRRDETLQIENGVRKFVHEEHISFVQMPGSYFIGHKTPPSGHSREILGVLHDILNDKSINSDKIKAIGCDGTNVNTGHEGGVIRLFELSHHIPVQWIVCMLHGIELQLRTLIENLDGPFTSKNTLSGPIGRMLNDCERMEVVEFEPIEFPCDIVSEDIVLSTDQTYLYDICKAVSDGCVSPKLASRRGGPVNKVRFATTACRIVRVYIATENPSENLQTIVQFIIKVYAPMMLKIKYQSSVDFGALHLTELITSSRFLPLRARTLVDQSIGRNAYAAHAESVTLAMVNDEKVEVRRQGWLNILNARNANNNDQIRKFRVPEVNFQCSSYLNVINFDYADPPLLRDVVVTLERIDFLSSKKVLDHDFGAFLKETPVHTQAVERAVKLVTEVSKQVNGAKARDGYVLNTLASRNSTPKFNSKQDFVEVRTSKKYKI